ncbi:Ig-like domain-containing protein [Vibrio furnissii]|uniref:Ig-like domain-containing protein n=1 Tax=Vibrio furnissii TaxID=29494 RepID=UPI0013021933|nr:Ig-like domain-containing protein [Vibrio furnissii]
MISKRLLKKNKLPLAIFVTIIMLAGCGEGSDSGVVTPVKPGKEQNQFYAQDVVRQNSLAGLFYVDLSTNIGSDDGTKAALNQVTVLSSDADCRVISQNNSGFTLKANGAQVCDYRYRVGPALALMSTEISDNSYAEATVRAVTGNHSDLLMPISAVTSTGNAVTINIKSELSKVGYALDENFALSNMVTLPLAPTTRSTAIANPDEHSIEYIPGAGISSGVERVLYSYTDAEGNVLAGAIDIAVSTESNHAPVAKSAKVTEIVDPDTGEIRATVPWNKTIELDVSPLINDPDGDELKLIDVFVYGASATIQQDADGASFNDAVFQLNTTESGTKNISYTVSDLKGGFATGVIEVEVDEPYADLGDFSAPHTAQQAADFHAQFRSYGPGDGVTALKQIVNAAYDLEHAEAVCHVKGGVLPNERDWAEFYQEHPDGAVFSKNNWPVNLPYWVDTGDTIDLQNGEIKSQYVSHNYVSCISNHSVSVESITLNNRQSLEKTIIRGMSQRPEIKVTYSDGETSLISARKYSFSNSDLVDVIDNKIIAKGIGETEVYIEYSGLTTQYRLNIAEGEVSLSGGWIMKVGEVQPINMVYRVDENADFEPMPISEIEIEVPDIVDLSGSGNNYFIRGVSQGVTGITVRSSINGFDYEAHSELYIFDHDWCWKYGVVGTSDGVACIGYDEEVMQTALKELIESYGGNSRNPYINKERFYEFCSRLATYPIAIPDDVVITTQDGSTLDEVASVVGFISLSEDYKDVRKFYVRFGSSSGNYMILTSGGTGTGVPLCKKHEEDIRISAKISNVNEILLSVK